MDLSLDQIVHASKIKNPERRNRQRKRNNRPQRAFASTSAGQSAASASHKLWVANLADSVAQKDLEELFSEFGRVIKASLHHDESGKR